MYLCTTQLNLTHFWGKRLDPCCPLDHNYNQFKRNFVKLWQGNKQATTEDREERLGLDCMPYTEPLGWVLQDPTWAQRWSHWENQQWRIQALRWGGGPDTRPWDGGGGGSSQKNCFLVLGPSPGSTTDQYIPVLSLANTFRGNIPLPPPRGFFLLGAHDRFLPHPNLKSQNYEVQPYHLKSNLRWEWPVSQT